MNCIVMFKIATEYAVLMVANDVQSKSALKSECGRAGTEEPKYRSVRSLVFRSNPES